jgi:hypothetical protein
MSTQQRAFTVRLSPEHAEALAERARLFGESEPAYIRSLVIAELEREEGLRSDTDSIIAHVDTLTHHVNALTQHMGDLVAEFVNLSTWLQSQTQDLPEADSDVRREEGPRATA